MATCTEAPTVKLLMMVSLTTAVRLPILRRPMATWIRPTLRLTAVASSRGEAGASWVTLVSSRGGEGEEAEGTPWFWTTCTQSSVVS